MGHRRRGLGEAEVAARRRRYRLAKDLGGYLRASSPDCTICACCAEVTPDTPIAPTTLPSTIMRLPPARGVMFGSAAKRSPAPPAAMASSSALLGRLNIKAVRALPSASGSDASW